MSRDPRLVAVVIPDGAALFEVSVPLSVFGVDRTSTGAPELRAITVPADPRTPTAGTTAGLTLGGLSALDQADEAGIIAVPTWPDPTMAPSPELVRVLRTAADTGATVLGLCLGAYPLAYAGLLDGRRAITHWLWLDDFARRFPTIQVDNAALYVDEGPVITSAGTAAAVDACIHLVRREWGASAAAALARRMVVAPHREGGQSQFANPAPAIAPHDTSVAAVQQRALDQDAGVLTVADLARWYGRSRRTFDRDFRAATGQSPLQWLLHQRVFAAQRLLESTDLPVEEVARRAGFATAVSLRPHFRRILNTTPQRYRDTFQVTHG